MSGRLPIAELHVHLEGTLSPALVRTLAARNGAAADLPPFDWISPGHRWTDPRQWLTTMRRIGDACLRTPQDYVDALQDYARRLDEAGVIYAEICVSLSRLARGPHDDLAALTAACDAVPDLPIPVGVIAGLDGALPPAQAMDQLRRALRLQDRFLVGIDLQGVPGQPCTAFAEVFALAAASGLGRRVHAGEFQGPKSVWQALELGVERIAHGVRAVDDPALLERLARGGVVLDVCPGSNLALGLFRDMDHHPLRRLVDAKVPVTLSSDDPLYFNCTARGEYERAARHGFTSGELAAMSRTAIEASFAPADLRQRLLARLQGALQPA